MKRLIQKTNGKKTESLGMLMVIFQIISILAPDLVSPETEKAITIGISSGFIPTLLHRIWRNRKEVIKYISNKITSLKTAKNK